MFSDTLYMTQFNDRVRRLMQMIAGEVLIVSRHLKRSSVIDVIRIKDRVVRACRQRHPKTELQFEQWEKAARRQFDISKSDLKSKDRKLAKYEDDGKDEDSDDGKDDDKADGKEDDKADGKDDDKADGDEEGSKDDKKSKASKDNKSGDEDD